MAIKILETLCCSLFTKYQPVIVQWGTNEWYEGTVIKQTTESITIEFFDGPHDVPKEEWGEVHLARELENRKGAFTTREAKAKIVKSDIMRLRKITPTWYRITIEQDDWGLAESVVDIMKNRFNEWSVIDELHTGPSKAKDTERYRFSKFSSAKLFAQDLALAIKNDYSNLPSIMDDKYH